MKIRTIGAHGKTTVDLDLGVFLSISEREMQDIQEIELFLSNDNNEIFLNEGFNVTTIESTENLLGLAQSQPDSFEKFCEVIKGCKNLKTLNLADFELGSLLDETFKTLFDSINTLINLEKLNLSQNCLEDLTLDQWEHLLSLRIWENLQTLDLSGNRLYEFCLSPDFVMTDSHGDGDGNFENLSEKQRCFQILCIILERCKKKLLVLNLSACGLGRMKHEFLHALFGRINMLTNLKELNLRGNNFENCTLTYWEDFFSLSILRNLEALNLSKNNFCCFANDNALMWLSEKLSHLKNIERLDLSECNLAALFYFPNQKLPEGAGAIFFYAMLASCQNLWWLNLSNNFVNCLFDQNHKLNKTYFSLFHTPIILFKNKNLEYLLLAERSFHEATAEELEFIKKTLLVDIQEGYKNFLKVDLGEQFNKYISDIREKYDENFISIQSDPKQLSYEEADELILRGHIVSLLHNAFNQSKAHKSESVNFCKALTFRTNPNFPCTFSKQVKRCQEIVRRY